MPRLTTEQAAACDSYSEDRSKQNYDALCRAMSCTHIFDADMLADRVADLLDANTALTARAEQAERDRDTLAAEVRAWRAQDQEFDIAECIRSYESAASAAACDTREDARVRMDAVKESNNALGAATQATDASGALDRAAKGGA